MGLGKRRCWKPKIDWVGIGAHIFWLALWLGFYLVWGKFKWRTAEFGSPEWMFDNIGHALGGLAGGFQGMYELWYFFPFLYYERGRALRWFAIYIVIPAVVSLLAWGFEFGEMYHDFLDYAIQAQKGGADTTIDVGLAIVFSYTGIAAWHLYNRIKEKIRRQWSSAAIQDRINELMTRGKVLHEKENGIKDDRRELVRELRSIRRLQVKDIPPNIWTALKETIGLTKDDEEEY